MKEHYISYVLHDFMGSGDFDALFGDGWIEEDEFLQIIGRTSRLAFASYGIDADGRYKAQVAELFNLCRQENGIAKRGDDYVGNWYRLVVTKKDQVINRLKAENPVKSTLDAIGEIALARALRKVAEEDGLGNLDTGSSQSPDGPSDVVDIATEIPASDRIVRLDHNQLVEIDSPLEEIINAVEQSNSVGGEEGLRELILGRLKAGRELIRAAVFSIETLQLTLIVGLQMFIERYKDHAISAVAGNLLAMLIDVIRNG